MSVAWQQSTHGVPRKRAKVDRVTAVAFVIVVVVVSALAFAYVGLAASSARLSADIWQAHTKLGTVQREISRLETEIARLSSIPVLQTRSGALGYVPAESIQFVPAEVP